MIRKKTPGEFVFTNFGPVPLKVVAPINSRVYVVQQDDGFGHVKAIGRIDMLLSEPIPATENSEEVPAYYKQIGWIFTSQQFKANSLTLFADCHQAVIDNLVVDNPNLEFEIY